MSEAGHGEKTTLEPVHGDTAMSEAGHGGEDNARACTAGDTAMSEDGHGENPTTLQQQIYWSDRWNHQQR